MHVKGLDTGRRSQSIGADLMQPNTTTERDGSNGSSIKRRQLMKTAGAAAVGTVALSGVASATGKGISWVAFCGCDSYRIRCITEENGNVKRVFYTATGDDCQVFFKAGRPIYAVDPGSRIDAQTGTDVDSHPSDSRDPCGILGDPPSDGVKIESHELLESPRVENGCP